MAVREFKGIIANDWENPIITQSSNIDGGNWQQPFTPFDRTGAGNIKPGGIGEWRSESFGIGTGTSGQARWSVRVLDIADGDFGPDGLGHSEFLQVNWDVPFGQTQSPTLSCAVSRVNPEPSDAFSSPANPNPPVLEFRITSINGNHVAELTEIIPYVLTVPVSFFTHNLFLAWLIMWLLTIAPQKKIGVSNNGT